MSAERIRIAEPAPPYCSGCFAAKPTEVHIDFGAAWDGPMLPALEGVAGATAHSVDDLVLCRDCIARAAALIGLSNHAELQAQLVELEEANAVLHAKHEGQSAYIENLEAAIGSRTTVAPIAATVSDVASREPSPVAGATFSTLKPPKRRRSRPVRDVSQA